MATTLSHDPLWPRAGGWPALDELEPGTSVDLAILGVPAWRTSLSPTNAHETPAAIRPRSQRYSPALMPDRRPASTAASAPRHPDRSISPRWFRRRRRYPRTRRARGEARTIAAVSSALDRASALIALGGDNSVTVATALGAWGDDLASAGLVTIDAHYDLRDGVSNGSPVRRLVEAGLDPRRIVQIGIADFANSAAYARRAADLGITVIHRDELHGRDLAGLMAEAIEIAGAAAARAPRRRRRRVRPLGRARMPASVPGGLAAWELRASYAPRVPTGACAPPTSSRSTRPRCRRRPHRSARSTVRARVRGRVLARA